MSTAAHLLRLHYSVTVSCNFTDGVQVCIVAALAMPSMRHEGRVQLMVVTRNSQGFAMKSSSTFISTHRLMA